LEQLSEEPDEDIKDAENTTVELSGSPRRITDSALSYRSGLGLFLNANDPPIGYESYVLDLNRTSNDVRDFRNVEDNLDDLNVWDQSAEVRNSTVLHPEVFDPLPVGVVRRKTAVATRPNFLELLCVDSYALEYPELSSLPCTPRRTGNEVLDTEETDTNTSIARGVARSNSVDLGSYFVGSAGQLRRFKVIFCSDCCFKCRLIHLVMLMSSKTCCKTKRFKSQPLPVPHA